MNKKVNSRKADNSFLKVHRPVSQLSHKYNFKAYSLWCQILCLAGIRALSHKLNDISNIVLFIQMFYECIEGKKLLLIMIF